MQCTIWHSLADIAMLIVIQCGMVNQWYNSTVLVAIWLSIIDKTGIHSGIYWIIAIIILIFFHTTFFFETWVGTQDLSRKFLAWLWAHMRLSERGQKRYTNIITVQPWWITTTALDIHCTLYVECGYSSVVGTTYGVPSFGVIWNPMG